MLTIILAAGQSKRFQEEGYMVPKPFLRIEWRGRNLQMLDHVRYTLPREFTQLVCAVPEGYEKQMTECRAIVDTRGPADTALQMINRFEPVSCLILDADILNFTNDLYWLTHNKLPAVLVSKSANPAFSYVERLGHFRRVAEKHRISDYAVRGAYFVPDHAMVEFTMALEDILERDKEPYISHAFNNMITPKCAVETTYIPVDWGTPRDVLLSGARIISPKEETHAPDNSGERS